MMQKVTFITGCSTGISHEFSLQLNAKGWKVVATARRPETLEPLEKAGCMLKRWLPARLLDKIMRKKYGLDLLK